MENNNQTRGRTRAHKRHNSMENQKNVKHQIYFNAGRVHELKIFYIIELLNYRMQVVAV
jgi:hypothetical protein